MKKIILSSFISFTIFCYSLFSPQQTLANNYHDHINMLPDAEDFMVAKDWILDNITLGDLFRYTNDEGKENIINFMKEKLFVDPTEHFEDYQRVSFDKKYVKSLDQDLKNKIKDKWQDETLRMFFNHVLKSKKSSNLKDINGDDAEGILKSLLGMKNYEKNYKHDKEKAFNHYVNIDDFRRAILQKSNLKTIGKIFESYFKREPLNNRKVLGLTISAQGFSKDNIPKLKLIKEIAKKYNSEVIYYFSIVRSSLYKDDQENSLFKRRKNELVKILSLKSRTTIPSYLKMASVLRSSYPASSSTTTTIATPTVPEEKDELNAEELFMAADLIDGIDLTGSINETSDKTSKPNQFYNQLTSLFDLASKYNIRLRIHSFEKSNKGDFYDAFRKALLNYHGKLQLEIGHFNKVNEDWIEKVFIPLKKSKIDLSFNFNIASNKFLQENFKIKKSIKNMKKLIKHGFSIKLGSDGRGILDGSSFEEQMKFLIKNDPELLTFLAKKSPSFKKLIGEHCKSENFFDIFPHPDQAFYDQIQKVLLGEEEFSHGKK